MSALVIPFPTIYRAGKIRQVADILNRKRGYDADRYWCQTVLVIRRQMLAAQIDADVIERQLLEFERAVFRRLRPSKPQTRK